MRQAQIWGIEVGIGASWLLVGLFLFCEKKLDSRLSTGPHPLG